LEEFREVNCQDISFPAESNEAVKKWLSVWNHALEDKFICLGGPKAEIPVDNPQRGVKQCR
jgi:hypothetical protein